MWNIESLDLDAYLARIGHARVAPSADALRSLHRAHVLAIPFENIDVILGTHPGIGLDAIQAKLVGRQRGGYCYEHALLFGAALEQLGFDVVRRVGRVQPHKAGPRTHGLVRSGRTAGRVCAAPRACRRAPTRNGGRPRHSSRTSRRSRDAPSSCRRAPRRRSGRAPRRIAPRAGTDTGRPGGHAGGRRGASLARRPTTRE